MDEIAHTLASVSMPLILLIRLSPLVLLGWSMKSCQIGAMIDTSLLNALALELACEPVGMITASGVVVVGGVVWLPGGLEGDGVDDTVMGPCSEVKPLDLEVTIEVNGGPPFSLPIELDFALEPKEILKLCEAGDDERED